MLVVTTFRMAPCGTLRPTLAGLTPGPSLSSNVGLVDLVDGHLHRALVGDGAVAGHGDLLFVEVIRTGRNGSGTGLVEPRHPDREYPRARPVNTSSRKKREDTGHSNLPQEQGLGRRRVDGA